MVMSLPLDLSSIHRDASLGTLEKQLICPICLEVFTKPVVILPCQHNLCRKCANELYQVGIGGRFRCPSCQHEVVLDRHGVYGLQRNLLVENIIDVYKQASASCRPPPKPLAQINCEEHEGEKLNIYCITCRIPICSLCKVFGSHKSCQVAPISDVYQQQKTELNDAIGSLVATNECIQARINDLEEICRSIEENSRNQKQILGEKFDRLSGILEERRKIMLQQITYEQDEKTSWAQSLVQTYSEHVDTNSKLVQTALNAMEESEMAAFIQTSKSLTEQISGATKSAPVETLQPGYENMDHYKVDFNNEERALYQLNFIKPEEEVEEPPDITEPEPEPEVLPDPEPEPEHQPVHSRVANPEPDHELKLENLKDDLCETKEENQAQVDEGSARQTKVIAEKNGLNTKQDQTELESEEHDSGIRCHTSEAGEETKLWYKPNRPMLSPNQAKHFDHIHMSQPLDQFQQTETTLSMWMSGSIIPPSNENLTHLERGSLESNQPSMSDVDRNTCCELVSGPSNKDGMTLISPQGEPCSVGAQDNREMEQSTDTSFHYYSDAPMWWRGRSKQTCKQLARMHLQITQGWKPVLLLFQVSSARISFSFSWLIPLTKKKKACRSTCLFNSAGRNVQVLPQGKLNVVQKHTSRYCCNL